MSEQVIENNAGQAGAGAQASSAVESIAALTQEIAQLKDCLLYTSFHQRGLRGRGHAVVKLDTLLKLAQLLGRGPVSYTHLLTDSGS